MKIEVKVTDDEIRELVAAYLSKMLGFPVPAVALTSSGYGTTEYTLGKYGGYEYPSKPEKPAKPVPVDVPAAVPDSPPVSTAEVLADEKPPF